jgi:hypothetical protein
MIGGGSSKAGGAQQEQYPYFSTSGGVTPQQQSLADYDYGQQLLTGQGEFEGGGQGGGPIDSTMATQTAGGANVGKALNLSSMSNTNADAEYSAYQNAINIDQQNQGNALAEQQSQGTALGSSLGSLASLVKGGAGATPATA